MDDLKETPASDGQRSLSSTERRQWVRGVLVILALVVAVYSPLVLAGFVWDDVGQIVRNVDHLKLSAIPSFFTTDVWAMTGADNVQRPPYYRPLFLVSLAVDRAVWGTWAGGYHVHSILWHVASVLALSALLRRLVKLGPALLGVAVFALHPIQSESVCWISARVDPMGACFALLALWALLPRFPSPARLFLGGVSMTAALLSKEPTVFAVLLMAGIDWARFGRPAGGARYLAMGSSVAVWAGLRLAAGVSATDALPHARLEQLIPKIPELIGLYGRLLFWPLPLTTGRHLLYLEDPVVLAVAGWGGLVVGGAVLMWRGGRLAGAGLLFAVAAFFPSLYAAAGSYQLGERYLYLPLVGVAVALGAGLPMNLLSSRWARGFCYLLALSWLWILFNRVPDWHDGVTLTAAEVRDAPNPYSFGGYGLELVAAGRDREALPWLKRALSGSPPSQAVCEAAVRSSLRVESALEAASSAEATRARGCHPTYALVELHAIAFARAGRWDDVRRAVSFLGREMRTTSWLPAAGALARVDRDAAGYRELRGMAGGDGEAFERSVQAILDEASRELRKGEPAGIDAQ